MPDPCRLVRQVNQFLDGVWRRALLRLFGGQGNNDPFETARILAAVPELDGEVDETGFCKFRAVELPEQALNLEGLPEHTAVVIVIDHPNSG